jgi:hypothetical protein
MTQPAVDPNAQPQAPRPRPPTLTHVLEHTEQTLRVIDENGQRSVTVTPKVTTWLVGQPVPGDDSTIVHAMFRDDDGGVRVWVMPREGTVGAQHGLAFLIELPPSSVRFTMKTLHIQNLQAEIEADERAYVFNEPEGDPAPGDPDDGEGDPGELPPAAANGQPALGQS